MAKSNEKRGPESRHWPCVFLSGLMLAAFSALGPIDTLCMGDEREPENDLEHHLRDSALLSASRSVTSSFDASLEMRENVDFLLTPAILVSQALANAKTATLHFDAIIELNSSLVRTHVVLFTRYWVSGDAYLVAVVWSEPHAGGLNFPIYPPTLRLLSDRDQFAISHQIQHMYDGAFSKPLGPRGPFVHRFNAYTLSDIRFAEQETLGLFGDLESQCVDSGNKTSFHRQRLVLPEQTITLGFRQEGPTITIAGESRQYSQFVGVQYKGDRLHIVDYEPMQIGPRSVSLPTLVRVYSGHGKEFLRSARLARPVGSHTSGDQIEDAVGSFGRFDADDVKCRELLLKYWMKSVQDIAPADAKSLRRLLAHFDVPPPQDAGLGERLKHVNMRLQLAWMLHDGEQLEKDFQEYLSLLLADGLDGMVLFGGQKIIETTMRWGQLHATERLLRHWLDAAAFHNDVNTTLDFASVGFRRGWFWIVAHLMEQLLANPDVCSNQLFAAQAYRCIALSRILQMARNPEQTVRSERDLRQLAWVLRRNSSEELLAEFQASLDAAQQTCTALSEPTPLCLMLKSQLDAMNVSTTEIEGSGDAEEAEQSERR